MGSNVQKKIKDYLENTGVSVAEFERKAGIKTNVARNILRGQSKRPTGETLRAIAHLIGCNIQDLLPEGDNLTQSHTRSQVEAPIAIEYPELLNETLCYILKINKDNDYNLNLKQAVIILEEAYSYSIEKNPPQVDMDFIEWFVKKTTR